MLRRGEPVGLVLPSHPFVKQEIEVFRWNTTVEFLEIALHDAPEILNLVRRAKVPIAIVAAFVGVAIELQVVVASMAYGKDYFLRQPLRPFTFFPAS